MMKVGIIGAGPAGLTAAYQLGKLGVHVEVLEADDQVGGLARTIELWGQKVDLGPHRFFSNDARVNRLWLEIVGRDYRMVNRLTRILYRGRFFDYPLRPGNALQNLGLRTASGCIASALRQKLRPWRGLKPEATFEDWVVRRFGRRLFEMFFKSYSEKLWGISCQDLDADFAAQRIKKFSLTEAVKAALGTGQRRHATLVDRFAYPTGGTGMVYERMAAAIESQSGHVHLSSPVRKVLCNGRTVTGVQTASGSVHHFDHVISTMPLTLLVGAIGDPPPAVQSALAQLRFRNTILVYLQIASSRLFPDQWLYIHSPELEAGRITNFRNWTPELCRGKDETIVALEYWCYDEDPDWRADDATLIDRANRELRATGLLGTAEVLAAHVRRLPRCYPVYRRGYKRHLQVVADYLQGFSGLTPIGRYGAFKYNNQDHSILMGLLAAENIAAGANHLLWDVNTDYDNYHEAAVIDDAGLQPQPV